MSLPTGPELYPVVEATWAPVRSFDLGPWRIRAGGGGGQRVSAATAEAPFEAADLPLAEAAMRELGQTPLFLIREGDAALDALLESQGYYINDPVALYAIEVAQLTDRPIAPVSCFTVWPPLAIMSELWAEGGIGPERLEVMQRVAGPKTGLLSRTEDRPAGAGFVASHGNISMIHAIHIPEEFRRKGVASNMMRAAAHWAQDQAATYLSLAVTRANEGGNALYASLGMQVVGYYHYRKK